MTYLITLEQFSGPLDLLLRLIEEEKLDISRISLAKVTDQFIDYLKKKEIIDLPELSDFLYLAAKLLYIKSTILLPYLFPKEEEEISKLEEQLKTYQEYREATQLIRGILNKNQHSYSRERFFLSEGFFVPPKNVNLEKIYNFFQILVKNLEKELLIVKKIKRKTVSLADKIKEIDHLLESHKKLNFSFLFKKAKSKLEIIINFLAVLELVKRKIVEIQQNETFGEIKIYKL